MSDPLVHKDIKIVFSLGDAGLYEAVGFLGEGEESVLGEEALDRVSNGRIVRSDQDWSPIDHRLGPHGVSPELRRPPFPDAVKDHLLVTARPYPGNPGVVCGGWPADPNRRYYCPHSIESRWGPRVLVLRRA